MLLFAKHKDLRLLTILAIIKWSPPLSTEFAQHTLMILAQLPKAVEYTNCISAVG